MVRDFKRPGGPGEWDPHEDSPLDLGASDEAPPAYGELHDQLNLSQAGFNAGAAVTGTGTGFSLQRNRFKSSCGRANPSY